MVWGKIGVESGTRKFHVVILVSGTRRYAIGKEGLNWAFKFQEWSSVSREMSERCEKESTLK